MPSPARTISPTVVLPVGIGVVRTRRPSKSKLATRALGVSRTSSWPAAGSTAKAAGRTRAACAPSRTPTPPGPPSGTPASRAVANGERAGRRSITRSRYVSRHVSLRMLRRPYVATATYRTNRSGTRGICPVHASRPREDPSGRIGAHHERDRVRTSGRRDGDARPRAAHGVCRRRLDERRLVGSGRRRTRLRRQCEQRRDREAERGGHGFDEAFVLSHFSRPPL